MESAFYTVEEFEKVYKELGFDEEDIDRCRNIKDGFRSIIREERDYMFTSIKFVNEVTVLDNTTTMFLGIKRDAVYFIVENDVEGEVRRIYDEAVARFPGPETTKEGLLAAFFRLAVFFDGEYCEMAYNKTVELENMIIEGNVDENFHMRLHKIKGYLFAVKAYYDQMIDTFEAILDNIYGLFNESKLDKIATIRAKVCGLKDDTNSMIDLLSQLQTTYQSYLDNKLNNTMKLLTIITIIFMPITIIVGWYGMNFTAMPEINWKFGYTYVIGLSIALSCLVIYIAKKKKWF